MSMNFRAKKNGDVKHKTDERQKAILDMRCDEWAHRSAEVAGQLMPYTCRRSPFPTLSIVAAL